MRNPGDFQCGNEISNIGAIVGIKVVVSGDDEIDFLLPGETGRGHRVHVTDDAGFSALLAATIDREESNIDNFSGDSFRKLWRRNGVAGVEKGQSGPLQDITKVAVETIGIDLVFLVGGSDRFNDHVVKRKGSALVKAVVRSAAIPARCISSTLMRGPAK